MNCPHGLSDGVGLVSTLSELTDRLRSLRSADRETDAILAEHFGEPNAWLYYATGIGHRSNKLVWNSWSEEGGGWWMWHNQRGERNGRKTHAEAEALRNSPTYDHPTPETFEVVRHPNGHVPAYTASIDAALALVERASPGMTATCLDRAVKRITRDGVSWAGHGTDEIAREVLLVMMHFMGADEQGDDIS